MSNGVTNQYPSTNENSDGSYRTVYDVKQGIVIGGDFHLPITQNVEKFGPTDDPYIGRRHLRTSSTTFLVEQEIFNIRHSPTYKSKKIFLSAAKDIGRWTDVVRIIHSGPRLPCGNPSRVKSEDIYVTAIYN
jgi:hypothetical protein